jgi:HAD superfamily hydrolase (TIGR01484 family)
MIKHLILDLDGVLVENNKVNEELIKLALEIKKHIPISIATGRGYEQLKDLEINEIIEDGFLIIEAGSIIIKDGKRMKTWDELIVTNIPSINSLFKKIKKDKYDLIKKRDRSITGVDFKDLELLNEYSELKLDTNFKDFDILSKNAGKEKAINYLTNQGLIEKEFACIGNGDNDLEMLKLSLRPFTVANASEKVLNFVKDKGFISSKSSIEGTKEIFKLILNELEND